MSNCIRTAIIAIALTAAAMPLGCAPDKAEVLLARSPGSSVGNWGALPAMLGMRVHTQQRSDGTLPSEDLSRFKLIVLSTDMNAFHDQRRRLWEFVNAGGILVTWFPDDVRYSPDFWPYRIELSDHDPPKVTFLDIDHPLLEGLRGKEFTARICGGDVAKDWDRDNWAVLARTDLGPAMLVADYGNGHLVDVQFHGPLSSRRDVAEPIAENLIRWAGVPEITPIDLKNRSIAEVISSIAQKQMRPLQDGEYPRGTWEEVTAAQPPRGIRWSYPWGVTLYGILRTGEVTAAPQCIDFVLEHNAIAGRQYGWLQWQQDEFGRHTRPHGIHLLMRLACLDDCGSMGNQVLAGIMRHDAQPGDGLLLALKDIADHITNRQSRFEDGSLCRGSRLWIDDLYMSVPFLARWGTYTQDTAYYDDAARQIINFASRLQDEDGLWFHAWLDHRNRPSRHKWGRGNGWAIMAEVELLSQLPQTHPQRNKLLDILRRHIDGLKQTQAPSGMWRQVVNREGLWEETSCTGMFAYAVARACNRGWIPPENIAIARRAFEGLKTRVTPDGSVFGTCCGTGPSDSVGYYAKRPRPVNDGHGPGPVMLAGAEILAADKQ